MGSPNNENKLYYENSMIHPVIQVFLVASRAKQIIISAVVIILVLLVLRVIISYLVFGILLLPQLLS